MFGNVANIHVHENVRLVDHVAVSLEFRELFAQHRSPAFWKNVGTFESTVQLFKIRSVHLPQLDQLVRER
jgi:hypothetical protein